MFYTLLVLLAIALLSVLLILSNPLRKPVEDIRETVLKSIPIGMDMDEVLNIIENNKKWKISHTNHKYGYGIDKNGRPGENNDVHVGEKSIRANIGSYRNIFITDVIIYFGFDENSKLIDIAVRKDTDSL